MLKRIVILTFALLCISAAVFSAVLAMFSSLPTEILQKGLLFGAVGIIMLIADFCISDYRNDKQKQGRQFDTDDIIKYPKKKKRRKVYYGSAAKQSKKAEYTQNVKSEPPKPPYPYPRDKSKPYGSKENPIVVGMPEYSSTLVHDVKNNRWILTDGLGNGWIR